MTTVMFIIVFYIFMVFCYYYIWGPFIFSLKNSFQPFPSGRYNGDEFPQQLFVWESLYQSISFFIWL